MAKRVVRISEVATTKDRKGIVPVSPATWWRWCSAGIAPAPFKIGPNTTVWALDEIERFLAERAEAQ